MGFTEICHIKCGKLLKKIHINEDSHTTEEDISNSDIEEWQAACQVCLSTSPEFLLACEGGYECSNVIHSYCLPSGSSFEHWTCDDCEGDASESLTSEESSAEETGSDEVSSGESDPDADYMPNPDSPPRRSSTRLSYRGTSRELYELRSESSNSFIEPDSDDFSDDQSYSEELAEPTRRSSRVSRRKYRSSESESSDSEGYSVVTRRREVLQASVIRAEVNKESSPDTQPRPLRRLRRNNEQNIQMPKKKTKLNDGNSKDDLLMFIATEAKKEVEKVKDARVNSGRMIRILVGIVSRNERLHNIGDPRTAQKIRTVIRNHLAGVV
jgi:hypothetical protein